MRLSTFAWLSPALLLAAAAQAEPPPKGPSYIMQPHQMILVVTKDWKAVDGQLQRFEMDSSGWQPIGQPIRVVVGRQGMAWGLGLHPMPEPGPEKKEGDGKSPAGIFALRSTFGYEPQEKVPRIKMPYVQCTKALECVDDPKSSHYNQILDRPTNSQPDWQSSEKMLLKNDQYRLGIVVEHNASPPESGAGSCVFIHIWEGPGIGTSGCTAMRAGDLESILGWIDIRSNPVLVQLPEGEYRRLQKAWRLPENPATAEDK